MATQSHPQEFATGQMDDFGNDYFSCVNIFRAVVMSDQAFGSFGTYGFCFSPVGYLTQADLASPIQQVL